MPQSANVEFSMNKTLLSSLNCRAVIFFAFVVSNMLQNNIYVYLFWGYFFQNPAIQWK